MDLASLPAIDQHAHPLLTPAAAALQPFIAAFTEASDRETWERHARTTLFFRRSLRDLGTLLDCAPTEDAILCRRHQLGLEALTRLCFTSANLAALLLDDGFLAGQTLPLDWHARFLSTRRILRLETLAQEMLALSDNFETFLERYRAALDPPPPGVVAFKSIAAYRTGLEVQPVARERAAACFSEVSGRGLVRLDNKPMLDFLLTEAVEIAAKHRRPVQFHTGFGDRDLDLRLANPLHLRWLLEQPRFQAAPVVLLHASYPFGREAGYLASVYPQVYVDVGLAVPFLSVAGMRSVWHSLLELAPTSKIMYSSDAHFIPELFFLAAKWGRQLLGEVLDEEVRDGDLRAGEADAVAAAILRANAQSLYGL